MRERGGLFFVEKIDVIVIVFQMLEEMVDGKNAGYEMYNCLSRVWPLPNHFLERMRSRNKLWS